MSVYDIGQALGVADSGAMRLSAVWKSSGKKRSSAIPYNALDPPVPEPMKGTKCLGLSGLLISDGVAVAAGFGKNLTAVRFLMLQCRISAEKCFGEVSRQ